MTTSLTREEMAKFYNKEYADILENGLITAYGNYLSGNFFKTFFNGLTPKSGCYLKAHLLSSDKVSRDTQPNIKKDGFDSFLKCTLAQKLYYNISSNYYGDKILENLQKKFSSNIFESNNDSFKLSGSLFEISNRSTLEEFLVITNQSLSEYSESNWISTDGINSKQHNNLDVAQNLIEQCQKLGIHKEQILHLIETVYK